MVDTIIYRIFWNSHSDVKPDWFEECGTICGEISSICHKILRKDSKQKWNASRVATRYDHRCRTLNIWVIYGYTIQAWYRSEVWSQLNIWHMKMIWPESKSSLYGLHKWFKSHQYPPTSKRRPLIVWHLYGIILNLKNPFIYSQANVRT